MFNWVINQLAHVFPFLRKLGHEDWQPSDESPPRKKITAKEFREQGYLQELNRQFLHPLGLALEVIRDANGSERFGEVWDNRDDPQGFIYGSYVIDSKKAERICAELEDKARTRHRSLGYLVQPPNKAGR